MIDDPGALKNRMVDAMMKTHAAESPSREDREVESSAE